MARPQPSSRPRKIRLPQRLTALVCILDVPCIAVRTVVLLVLAQCVLLVYSAWVHSPTLDEPAHLVAGLRNLRTGDSDVYRVNPPLVRSIAAVPVLVAGLNKYEAGTDA